MTKRIITIAVSVALSFAAFSSCSNDPTLTGTDTTGANLVFIQIDRTGKAGLSEVFSPYSRHDASNRVTPQADITSMQSDINSFVTSSTYGNRSVATSSFLQALLGTDALVFDYSQSSDASYLGVETNGQINDVCTGTRNGNGKFGGRGLTEDVVTTTFSLVFGSLPSTIAAGSNVGSGAVADDGNEKDGRAGRPNLTTDNVGCSNKHFTFAQFPYLGNPH